MNRPLRQQSNVSAPIPEGRIAAYYGSPGSAIDRIPLTLLLLGLILLGWVQPLLAQINPEQYRQDLERIASPTSRILGSEGYYQTVEYLQSQIQAIPNVQLQRHEFDVMVPVTRSAVLTLPDGTQHPVYPFWPAHIRLNTTPAEGITGKLVYVGEADYPEILPSKLAGQIAVVEASSRERWRDLSYFGATAIVVLGTDQTSHVDLRSHELFVPINIPRVFIPDGPLAQALRAERVTGASNLKVLANWESRKAVNLYAYVPPRVPRMEGWTLQTPPAAMMISAPIESSSLVPDLAPGASQAANTAAALNMLRDMAQRPLDRPVVFFFSGADSIQFLGTRQMLLAMGDAPATWRREQVTLNRQLSDAERALKRAREVVDKPYELRVGPDRDLLARIIKIIETDIALEQDRLFRIRMMPADERTPEHDRMEDEMEANQIHLNRLKFGFQQKPASLKDEPLLADAKSFVRRTIERLAGTETTDGLIRNFQQRNAELNRRIELYEWLANLTGRDPNPDERNTSQRPIELLLGLDLSDAGVRCGPLFWGEFQRSSNIADIQDYRDWFTRLRAGTEWFDRIRPYLDFEPLSQARHPRAYLKAPLPIPSEMAQAWGIPGMSMMTLDDLRLRRDTPLDTLESLNIQPILQQLDAVNTLMRHAWNEPRFRGPIEKRRARQGFEGQVVSPSLGRPVPDLPRPGFLVTYYPVTNIARKTPAIRGLPALVGIRRAEIRNTDAEGRYRFEGLSRMGENRQFAVCVYRITPDTGEITATTDFGRQAADIRFYVNIDSDPSPLRSLVFNCEEFSLAGIYDPRFLQALNELILLDARRNAEPQRFNFILHDKMMAGFVEPGARSYLVFRYGRVGNRLLLLNMPRLGTAEAEAAAAAARRAARGVGSDGRGFTARELNRMRPLALETSQDFWLLNHQRLGDYARAGVSSPLLDQLHAEAEEQIRLAEKTYQAGTGADLVREANGAWANAARVYNAAQDMARDVIRAAIFLLLLCVPFAFCMERLLIASPNIYKQIAGIFVLFAIMTLALWSFHPAFKISSSPLIIILAFAIIFMSLVVIFVIYSRFDTELKRIRSGRGTAQTTSFARASVLTSAVLLGVANMRKRKFRTALTSITIVLITFAVLCFTSATRYIGTTELPTGISSSHPGLLLRQRGFRPMPIDVAQNLQSVLGPQIQVVQRWWNVSAGEPKEQYHLVAPQPEGPPRIVAVQALLGLTPGESKLSAIDEVIGPEKFARLENGEQNIIYFSREIADQLGVEEGDSLLLGGMSLEVAGIFDSASFDRRVLMLSGESLAPLRYSTGMLDASGRRLADTAMESLDLDAEATAAELAGSYEHLPATQFAIIPAQVSRMLYNSSLRTIGIGLANEAQVREKADELTKRFALATFAGFDDGVKMVAASELASVSGAGQVAIPLAIAGLIIFNTMMGSIAERKREIHVYTSLGLAPMHVGALFVAEALTYGLIGAVFGYIIGQGAGTAMLHLGWLGDVTLNYSGTSAILTMSLILLVVLLSALVPARLASKLAAPSIDRTWRVPLPKGDEIVAQLPFTINKTAADGALAYLAEFFDAHQEGSIGKFSAGKVEVFSFDDPVKGVSRGLKTIIWLTPFDLGVRQHLLLLIHPGQYQDIYEVQVVLQRLSGDDGSWYRMNRTFLTELRKQFLQWRSLSPQRMLEYVEESRRLFADAPSRVVTTVPGETVRLG